MGSIRSPSGRAACSGSSWTQNSSRRWIFRPPRNIARDEAERIAESQIFDAIEENLPEGEDEAECNWEALAKFSNTRWKTNYREKDLKKIGREGISETLIAKARDAIAATDLSEGAKFLEEDFGVRSACNWVHHKFGISLDPQEVRSLEPRPFVELVRGKSATAYEEKEIEYPVMTGLYHFTARDSGGQKRVDREGLAEWAGRRFPGNLDPEQIKNKQRDELRSLLIEHSRKNHQLADETLAELRRRVNDLPEAALNGNRESAAIAQSSLLAWVRETTGVEVKSEQLVNLDREGLKNQLALHIEDRFRPEMRRMERALVLEILDAAWKDHLLAMDHLRSAVGLRGWAQIDPKVEYKREGMRTFEQMWTSIGERVTDLIFRMEQLDEQSVGSTWKESAATHAEAQSTSDMARQQQTAIDSSENTDQKIEPIRNLQKKIGRNDPCPCGSGKKYKNCHMKKGGLTAV